ncbi:MAG: hypothetical protein ACOC25_04905 [Alkalispirochaetaceae bacterium]
MILAGTTFAMEVDSLFRVRGFPGSQLLDTGTLNYARSVAATPAGTLYFQPAQGNEVYRLVEGAERPQRLRAGVGGYGPLTVLPDGTIVTLDIMTKRAAAVSGRERRELDLFAYPEAYIAATAAGPLGNIWVFDSVEQRISVVTPEGRFVDTIIPALPPSITTQTAAMAVYPTGEFLLLSRAGLWKLGRDGQPIWGVSELPAAANTSFQQMTGVAVDPVRGLIYLADGASRALLRLREKTRAVAAGSPGDAAREPGLSRSGAVEPGPGPGPSGAVEPGAGQPGSSGAVEPGTPRRELTGRDLSGGELSGERDLERDSRAREELVRLNRELGERPEEPELLLGKASIYEEVGATRLAEVTYTHVLDLDLFNETANTGLERMQLARLREQATRFAETARSQLRTLGPATAQQSYLQAMQTFEQILMRRPGDEELRREMNALRDSFAQGESGSGTSPLRIDDLAMENLFPGLFSTYRSRPVGTVTLENRGEEAISDIRVTAELRRYTDFPTETSLGRPLAPGESVELPFRLLLNSNVFEVEEDLPLQLRLRVSGETGSREVLSEATAGFTLYRRTALTWRETEMLAGFVTPNEGNVSRFALGAANSAPEMEQPGLSRLLLRAGRIGDALGIRRMTYVEDPQTPISEILGRTDVVDTVRLPRTTLLSRAGDCDDTTALLCSLYEAAGIGTAIVTTPDHVLMAFDTGEPPTNRWLYEEAGLIPFLAEDRLWLPVETTVISEGFYTALEAASRRIREAGGIEGAGFVTTAAAREQYPTIPVPPTELNIPLPPEEEIGRRLDASAAALRDRVYREAVARIEGEVREGRGSERSLALLRLGALHGRFEAFGEAEEALRDALESGTEDALPRIHLATLFLRQDRPEEAVEVLLPLQTRRPDSLIVSALLARGYLAVGEATKGRRLAGKVVERSPELARRYGLDPGAGGSRGSDDFDPAVFPLPSAEEELAGAGVFGPGSPGSGE